MNISQRIYKIKKVEEYDDLASKYNRKADINASMLYYAGLMALVGLTKIEGLEDLPKWAEIVKYIVGFAGISLVAHSIKSLVTNVNKKSKYETLSEQFQNELELDKLDKGVTPDYSMCLKKGK